MTTIEKLPLTETVNNHMFRSDPMLALKALDTLFHPGEFVWVTDDLNRACFSIPVAEAKQWVGASLGDNIPNQMALPIICCQYAYLFCGIS